jgi:membrane-associated phospholipid phosphatase
MPAVGPVRATEVAPAVRVQLAAQGGAVTAGLRRGINALERTPQDAFPSAHTSIAVLVAVFARRFRLRGHVLFAAAAAAIMCSTVVLGYHYVVDVAASFPIAWLALDRGFMPHLKSRAWRSSITSTSG